MGPIEVIVVDNKKVSCDGTNHKPADASKHPLVYLNMGAENHVICPYCSRYFTTVKSTTHFVASGHKHINS